MSKWMQTSETRWEARVGPLHAVIIITEDTYQCRVTEARGYNGTETLFFIHGVAGTEDLPTLQTYAEEILALVS